jgi:nucleotide-binding universal stress UspA family protein
MINPGHNIMMNILIPVDGSKNSDDAVRYTMRLLRSGTRAQLHLINVQPGLSGDVTAFVAADTIADFHQERSRVESQSACALLDADKTPYRLHTAVGPIAEKIAQCVRQHAIDQVVMGSRGMGSIGNLLLGSVATKVIHLVAVPVTLVK